MCDKTEKLYKSYKRIGFLLNGYSGSVIFPKKAVKNNRWIWRTEFLGTFDRADMTLVDMGWHLVYYNISDKYGSPEAVELMNGFHEYVIEEFKLSKKTVLFGFSRGGLYAVNYAVKYPEKIDSIYLDAPVIDIRSWPGGYGKGIGAPMQWQECLECYSFDENDAKAYSEKQLNRADVLAENKIPILVITGDADLTVPYKENSKPFIDRYKQMHDDIQVIIKPDCGHHPHSLDDVSPIIKFISRDNI